MKIKVNIRQIQILSIFFGIIAITAEIGSLTAAIDYYPLTGHLFVDIITIIIVIIATFILFFTCILVILPLSFYQKSFIRKISPLLPILLISVFIFSGIFFLFHLRDVFYGDFFIIPFYSLVGLLAGIICIPFLNKKSKEIYKNFK